MIYMYGKTAEAIRESEYVQDIPPKHLAKSQVYILCQRNSGLTASVLDEYIGEIFSEKGSVLLCSHHSNMYKDVLGIMEVKTS